MRRLALTMLLTGLALATGGGLAVAQPAVPTAPGPTTPLTSSPPPTTTNSPPAQTSPSTAAPPTSPPPLVSPTQDDDPSWWDIPGQIRKAINDWFTALVVDALNPLLDLIGATLLSTSDLVVGERVEQLWNSARVAANALYLLFVMIGGLVLMSHETLQTRYTIKQIAPRLVVGFLAGNLSLLLIRQAIPIGNALAAALVGGGVDPVGARDVLRALLVGAITPNGTVFLALIGLVAAALLLVLLATHIFCTAVLVLLVFIAPLALACHALPHTEGIAQAWWRLTGALLAVPVAQTATLMTGLRIFLAPGGFTWFGMPTENGLVNLLVTCTLLYVLVRIPFWFLRAASGPGGRSALVSMVKAILVYKALGALGLTRHGHRVGTTGSATARHTPASGAKAVAAAPRRPARHRPAGAAPPGARRRTMPSRRPLGPAAPMRFLQPTPQVPTHELPIRSAPSAPATIEFRAPGDRTDRTAPLPRPAAPARAPRFQPATSAPNIATRPRPGGSAPTAARFQPATPHAPGPPATQATRSPSAPVFVPAVQPIEQVTARRTHTPAPVLFRGPASAAPLEQPLTARPSAGSRSTAAARTSTSPHGPAASTDRTRQPASTRPANSSGAEQPTASSAAAPTRPTRSTPPSPPPTMPPRVRHVPRATQLPLPLDVGRRPRPVQYRLPLDLPSLQTCEACGQVRTRGGCRNPTCPETAISGEAR